MGWEWTAGDRRSGPVPTADRLTTPIRPPRPRRRRADRDVVPSGSPRPHRGSGAIPPPDDTPRATIPRPWGSAEVGKKTSQLHGLTRLSASVTDHRMVGLHGNCLRRGLTARR